LSVFIKAAKFIGGRPGIWLVLINKTTQERGLGPVMAGGAIISNYPGSWWLYVGETPRVDRTQIRLTTERHVTTETTNAQAESQKQWPLAAPMRLPTPVFHPCRGRSALPRASGDWRETFPRCTRGASLEEQKVQQEHKKISWFRSSGSSQARAQVKKNAVAQGKRGRLPSRSHHRSPLWPRKGVDTRKGTCKTKEVYGKGTAAAPKPSLV
jgi:hypothetical protein